MAGLTEWFDGLNGQVRSLVALLLGLGIGLGQAPWSMPYLAFFALILTLAAFGRLDHWRVAAGFGWVVGLGYFGITLFWIVEPFLVDIARHGWMAPFALVLFVGGMALFWALGFGLAAWLGRSRRTRLLALVICLTLAELLRSYLFTGFPWGLLGYMWLDTPFVDLAALVGPHGLGALTLLVVVLPLSFRAFPATAMVAGLAAICLIGLLVTAHTPMSSSGQIIRLIQPNAPQHEKWDPRFVEKFFNRQVGFTAAKADVAPDIIIWPEASVPFLLDTELELQQQITAAANGAMVVIGANRYQDGRYYNALAVLGENGLAAQTYDKRHLVPFGEYVPLGSLLSRLGIRGMTSQEGGGFAPGQSLALLDFGAAGKALPLICYEAIFPQISRQSSYQTGRPDWLLQITNDAWFGKFAGPQQHLAQARMRAIEQGLPMVRVANTGVSAVIDAQGKITAQLGLGRAGYLDALLPPSKPATPYSRTGDWLVLMLLLGGFGALVLISRKTR